MRSVWIRRNAASSDVTPIKHSRRRAAQESPQTPRLGGSEATREGVARFPRCRPRDDAAGDSGASDQAPCRTARASCGRHRRETSERMACWNHRRWRHSSRIADVGQRRSASARTRIAHCPTPFCVRSSLLSSAISSTILSPGSMVGLSERAAPGRHGLAEGSKNYCTAFPRVRQAFGSGLLSN